MGYGLLTGARKKTKTLINTDYIGCLGIKTLSAGSSGTSSLFISKRAPRLAALSFPYREIARAKKPIVVLVHVGGIVRFGLL